MKKEALLSALLAGACASGLAAPVRASGLNSAQQTEKARTIVLNETGEGDPETVKTTITFKSNGEGYINNSTLDVVYKNVEKGTQVPVPEPGSKDFSTFIKWIDKNGNDVDLGETVTATDEDQVFTAVFEAKVINVTWRVRDNKCASISLPKESYKRRGLSVNEDGSITYRGTKKDTVNNNTIYFPDAAFEDGYSKFTDSNKSYWNKSDQPNSQYTWTTIKWSPSYDGIVFELVASPLAMINVSVNYVKEGTDEKLYGFSTDLTLNRTYTVDNYHGRALAEALEGTGYALADSQKGNTLLYDAANTVSLIDPDGNRTAATKEGRKYYLNVEVAPVTVQEVNKSLLQQAVAYANALVENGLPEHLNAIVLGQFNEALEEARGILEDVSVSQERVNASWLRLTSLIHMIDFTADKTELQTLVEQMSAVDLDKYEDGEVKDAFVSALESARNVLKDETALDERITAALENLKAAFGNLRADVSDLDTSMLELLIETADGLDLDAYVEAGKEELRSTLAQAKGVLENPESQQQIDESALALHQAYLNLRLKADEALLANIRQTMADVRELCALCQDASLKQAALKTLEAADAYLAQADPEQEEGKAVLHQLVKTRTRLEESSFQAGSASIDAPAGQREENRTASTSARSVKTSAFLHLGSWSASAAAALGSLVLLKKRVRK